MSKDGETIFFFHLWTSSKKKMWRGAPWAKKRWRFLMIYRGSLIITLHWERERPSYSLNLITNLYTISLCDVTCVCGEGRAGRLHSAHEWWEKISSLSLSSTGIWCSVEKIWRQQRRWIKEDFQSLFFFFFYFLVLFIAHTFLLRCKIFQLRATTRTSFLSVRFLLGTSPFIYSFTLDIAWSGHT